MREALRALTSDVRDRARGKFIYSCITEFGFRGYTQRYGTVTVTVPPGTDYRTNVRTLGLPRSTSRAPAPPETNHLDGLD